MQDSEGLPRGGNSKTSAQFFQEVFMFEYVKDYGLTPKRPYTERARTNLIVLHHVEGTMSVKAIHAMHMADTDANYSGIAYNIYIDKDGTVAWGRGLEYAGGHVANGYAETRGVNDRSVGIVCNGNFNKEKMSEAQKEALKKVVADVVRYYNFNSITQIVTHKEIAGAYHTNCPGKYFPIENVREYILNGGKTVKRDTDTEWIVAVSVVNFRSAPEFGNNIITQLHGGDVVELSRYVKGEKWARVVYGGVTGWVWLPYLEEV